jgi:hypothetical protein
MMQQLIPPDLATMPPGPELGALLAGIDISARTGAMWLKYYGPAPGSYPMSKPGR